MNPSKRKGDTFERDIVHQAETLGLRAYRNRMSRASPGESWDVSIAGRRLECKKRRDSFKKIRGWMTGNDGVIIGCDYEKPLVVMRYDEWLKLL